MNRKLRDGIMLKIETGAQEIDMLHWAARTALELVGQSGLGAWTESFTCGFLIPLSLRVQLR